MVRMTDLLKKAKEQVEELEEKKAAAPPPVKEKRPPKKKPPAAKREPLKPARPEEEEPPEEEVKFAELVLGPAERPPVEKREIVGGFEKPSIPTEEETKEIYFAAIESAKRLYTAYKNGVEVSKEDALDTAQKIVNNIILGSRVLLKLFHEIVSIEDYSYYNAVNVSILSVAIGMVYGYNKSTLSNLATVGLLHDLDLIKQKEIIDKSEKLSEEEFKEVRKHPLNTAAYVDHAFNFSKKMVSAILQHHERRSGKGYPSRLTEREIEDLAVIVGIADTYEAMTHSRPYKEKMPGHTAILNIINTGKDLFSNEAIKALVACVGLYPVGSWVELNTGEICKVLLTNIDAPLRPVISIVMDKDKNKYREIRTMDLQKTPSLYIKNIIEKDVT